MTDTKTVPEGAPDWVQYEAAVGVACLTCGAEAVGVKAHDVGFDYCRNCYHTGIAEEHLREDQLLDFRLAMPDWTIAVNHTGGGCFWLAFTPPGSEGTFYAATDGEASMPTSVATDDEESVPIRDGWGWVGRLYWNDEDTDGSEQHDDYEGTTIAEPTVPLAMEEKTYTNAAGETSTYQTYSDRYWNEYPEHCMSDAEIVAAILADWTKRA